MSYWLERFKWWLVLTWHEMGCQAGFASIPGLAWCKTCDKTWRSE